MAIVTPTSETISYDRTLSLTTHEVMPDIYDNVFGTNETLRVMNELVRKYEWNSGNNTLQVPLLLANPGKAQAYGAFGVLNNSPDKAWTAARWDASQIGRGCRIAQLDIDAVQGSPAAMQGLVSESLMVVVKDMADYLNKTLWRDGTTNAGDFPGFAAAVASDPTADTYGQVPSASNTSWQNAATENNNVSADILKDLRTSKTAATFGREKPTVFLTGRTERNGLEGKLTATIRVDPIVMARGGAGSGHIEELQFGEARVLVDENRVTYGGGTGNLVVMINPNAWRRAPRPSDFGHAVNSQVPGADGMRVDDFQRLPGQTVYECVMRWLGLYFTNMRRWNAVTFDLAAS